MPLSGNHAVTDTYTCRRALKLAVPGLSVHTVEPLQPGWDSTVFLVNNDWVFRFPLRPEVAQSLQREIQLLPLIAENTGVSVPEFACVASPNEVTEFPFVGYRWLPGVSLDKVIRSLDHNSRSTIALQVGRFLRGLHQMPSESGLRAGLEPFSHSRSRETRLTMFTSAMERAESELESDQASRVGNYVQSLFRQIDWVGIKPAIVHGDLGSEHILVDADSDCRVSIIDFGDLSFDDPAVDFAGLPEDLLPEVLESYGLDLGSDFTLRRALYQSLVPAYAIEAGQRLNRPDLTEEGIEGYRRLAEAIL